jgi:hypothetical protein
MADDSIRMVGSSTLTSVDGTLRVNGSTQMVDNGTLMSADSTWTVDDSTLVVGGGTWMIDDNTLTVGDGTLTSDGQHRLGSAIARMTQHCHHQHDSAATSHHGQVASATPSLA